MARICEYDSYLNAIFFDTSADVIVADGLSRIHAVSVRNTRYTDVIRDVADGLCRIRAVSVRITRYNFNISLDGLL